MILIDVLGFMFSQLLTAYDNDISGWVLVAGPLPSWFKTHKQTFTKLMVIDTVSGFIIEIWK